LNLIEIYLFFFVSLRLRLSFDFNVLDYIWSDIDNNIPSEYVWTPSTSRIPVGDAKFSLKAVAISMDLQRYDKNIEYLSVYICSFLVYVGN